MARLGRSYPAKATVGPDQRYIIGVPPVVPTVSGMRNLALGRPVTVSETPSGSWPEMPISVIRSGDSDWAVAGGKLTDGNPGFPAGFSEGYLGYSSGTDITFLLDLGSAHTGHLVRVYGFYGVSGLGRPLQAMLEQSDNGTSFTTVVDMSGLTAGGQPGARTWFVEFDISAETSHRYWRVTLERGESWLFVGDIELLDGDSENPALGCPVTISETPNGSYPDSKLDIIRVGDTDWQTAAGSQLTDGVTGDPNTFDWGHVGFNSGTDITFVTDFGVASEGSVYQAVGWFGNGNIGRPEQAKLEYSDDNSNWTIVDDKASLTGSTTGPARWMAEFDISAEGSHRYWRWTLQRHSTFLFVSELAMWT